MQQSFGSYFELELQRRNDYIFHSDSILLNTGRNALEYIIKAYNIKKIYLPFLSCEALLTPVKRVKIQYAFYPVDNNQEPIFDYNTLSDSDFLLYINYFGLKNHIIENLTSKVKNLIIDNTQAFFSLPLKQTPTFYSTRKFFGVADGALLCNVSSKIQLNIDKSSKRMMHLMLRAENESDIGYSSYLKTEINLNKLPLMEMSELTKKILLSVDFQLHREMRNANFSFLADSFHMINKYSFNSYDGPMAYPLWIENGGLIKKRLKESKVYIPTLWPNVLNSTEEDSIEFDMVNNILPIPVDKRYSYTSLREVVTLIRKLL